MVAIDVEEPAGKAVEFRDRHGLTFPVLADPSRRLFNHFFLPPNYSLPYTVLVGRDGVIRKVGIPGHSLREAVESAL